MSRVFFGLLVLLAIVSAVNAQYSYNQPNMIDQARIARNGGSYHTSSSYYSEQQRSEDRRLQEQLAQQAAAAKAAADAKAKAAADAAAAAAKAQADAAAKAKADAAAAAALAAQQAADKAIADKAIADAQAKAAADAAAAAAKAANPAARAKPAQPRVCNTSAWKYVQPTNGAAGYWLNVSTKEIATKQQPVGVRGTCMSATANVKQCGGRGVPANQSQGCLISQLCCPDPVAAAGRSFLEQNEVQVAFKQGERQF